jgi:hypothetical protein
MKKRRNKNLAPKKKRKEPTLVSSAPDTENIRLRKWFH